MLALRIGEKASAQYPGAPFQEPCRTACEKLSTQLQTRQRQTLSDSLDAIVFRPFAPEEVDRRIFDFRL